MQLHYRGNCYQSHPQKIETIQTGFATKYRGLTYQVCRPLSKAYSQPPVNLKYRGVTYTVY